MPEVPCHRQNHYQMPFEYVCMDAHCLKNSQELACVYCCQEIHNTHLPDIQALRVLIDRYRSGQSKPQEGGGGFLLEGIDRCRTESELRQNLSEVIMYNRGLPKYQKIVDHDNEASRQEARRFYQERNRAEPELQKTVKKPSRLIQTQDTHFLAPIFTFCQQDAQQQKYQLKSPFCVANGNEQRLVTVLAYPPINKFPQSVELAIKIQQITPFWLGLGVSVGKNKYAVNSKHHIIVTSNGWLSLKGETRPTAVKYCLKDTVSIKVDRRIDKVEFNCNGEKQTVDLDFKWNEDLYFCAVLFYKGDSVQIMA